MGLLNESLKKEETKQKISAPGSVSEAMFVPTGVDIIDFECGTYKVNDEGEEVYNLGIPMGKIIIYIGHSQSGKTTKAIQDAYAMAKDLNGDVIVLDFERSSNDVESRIMNITGCSLEEFNSTFTVFKQTNLTVEYVKKFMFDIVEQKKKQGKKCLVDWFDANGKPIKIYPPTIFIFDSVASARNQELLDSAEMDTNMTGASIAKSNSAFLVSVEHLLEEFNITLMGINHITTKIVTNRYAPKKIQLPGLGDDENIPGGNKWVFLASYIFKLAAGAELKQGADLFIQGRMVNFQLIKTRSGYNAKKIPIVYTAREGFSNLLTNFAYAKENKKFQGGGKPGFYLPSLPDQTFTQKAFVKTYMESEEFQEHFNGLVQEDFITKLQTKNAPIYDGDADTTEENLEESFDE
jgi:RecA/RadA recombinase